MSLDHDRAFFQVVYDPARPFRVEAGGDIGTRFEVALLSSATSVSLVAGTVRVTSPQISRETEMRPGTRPTMRDGHWHVVDEMAARQVEWRSGIISVDDRPVGDVVAELNRYLARPLIVRDEAAAKICVSGVFRLAGPQGCLATLAAMGKGSPVRSAPPAGCLSALPQNVRRGRLRWAR